MDKVCVGHTAPVRRCCGAWRCAVSRSISCCVSSCRAGGLAHPSRLFRNLRRTRFEPYHKDVTVDLFRVPERIIGDEAWSPADFKDANAGVGRAPSPAKPSSAKELSGGRASSPAEPSPTKEPDVGRTPSSAKGSLPDKRSDLAKLPSSTKESCAAPTPPEPQPKAPASNVSPSSLPSATEQRELQKAARAIPRALKGDWRDVKTLFEFAGIYPPKDNSSATDP